MNKEEAKRVWKKVFGCPCSRCGAHLPDPKWEFQKPRKNTFDEIVEKGWPIDVPGKSYMRYWAAKEDVVLCERCFEKWEYDAGSYRDFKREWAKFFKEIK